jgi:hypothetical protein
MCCLTTLLGFIKMSKDTNQHDEDVRWKCIPSVLDHQISSKRSHVTNGCVGNLEQMSFKHQIFTSNLCTKNIFQSYRAFQGFVQAFTHCLILGSSQFTLLPQLPLKMVLNLKVVKIDSKIIIWLLNLNPPHTL